ncbi:hypothetical protein [Lishizhenia sp.]|uniref:hypothetical protein n=1 Tax=Lishizhenia sp. TaxID=2497594 RepID=UPI00299DAA78|nr:hypothetical protein [Lishizhenia sp.]MDX1447192.1 hypothetical protein [Lishizhenia sp.]
MPKESSFLEQAVLDIMNAGDSNTSLLSFSFGAQNTPTAQEKVLTEEQKQKRTIIIMGGLFAALIILLIVLTKIR